MGARIHVGVDDASGKIPADEIKTVSSGLGLHAQWDTRDSQFYPRKGHVADAEIIFHDPAIGDSFSYQVMKLSYNGYQSLTENQVLAFRLMGQFENGDVPFYGLSQFGRGSDLRGYSIGQYQDKQMLAGQVEYRLMITKRFGVVAFGGVGEVAPSIGQLSLDNLLPSAGGGLRYVLAEQNHVALRLDVAWGKNGDSKFYLSVGEAF
jgi:outer membrane protein assembly factor BamA